MPYFPENVIPDTSESLALHYKSFINFFRARLEHYGGKDYMHYYINGNYKTLSYNQVDRISTNYACKLVQCLPKDLDTIALLNDHQANYLIIVLAFMKIRKTLFTISPRNSEAAVNHLLSKTDIKLIITSQRYERTARNAIETLDGVQHMLLDTFDFDELVKEPLNPDHEHLLNYEFTEEDIDKPVIILHSSGSTSYPKPMYIPNRYLFTAGKMFHINVNAIPDLVPIDEKDVFISLAPLFHQMGFVEFTTVVLFGASIVFIEKLPPSQEEIDHAFTCNKVTIILTAPIILEQMIHYLKQKKDYTNIQRLKYTFFGGASLKEESAQWLNERNVRARNAYGLTETGPLMCADAHPNSTSCNAVRPYHPIENYIFEQEDRNDPDLVHVAIRAGSPNLALNAINRPDGGYDTNDILRRDPERHGYFLYVGRRDDTLVMSTGEKTNPLPMEGTLRQCPMIRQAAVLGHERQVTCALIELNTDYAWNYSPQEIIATVQEAVAEVNKECPSQSTLIPEMVKILPFKDKIPVTDKGSLMRKKTLAVYKDVIDKLYDDFLNVKKQRPIQQDSSTWTQQQIEEFLVQCAADILKVPTSVFDDRTESIFNLGFNSINGIQLRNRILEHFDVSNNFLYQHATIRAISQALVNNVSTDDVEQRYSETQALAEAYIEKAKHDFPIISSTTTYSSDHHVVLLTGATGAIGSLVLARLLETPSVKKVYCLVRGPQDTSFQRLIDTFESRFLDTSLLTKDRVTALSMQLHAPFLGLSEPDYHQLREEVTIVQHCAWLLDFNMTIGHYDKECIAPFYNLLQFAARPERPMHVHFISSVSASAGAGVEVLEAPLPLDAHVSMPMGYAQSKFVTEVLLNYLVTEKHLPCYIERVGQVCGDSVHGVWNVTEQYPLMFVGGGVTMQQMPVLDISVDWIPVDYAAKSIADIMLQTAHLGADIDRSIYHIVNPTQIAWKDVLQALEQSGLNFAAVSPEDWVAAVEKDTANPCHRLVSFYESNLKSTLQMPVWKTEKTRQVTPIDQVPVFNTELFNKYLQYWRSVGFA